jgi:hypothetical protein
MFRFPKDRLSHLSHVCLEASSFILSGRHVDEVWKFKIVLTIKVRIGL